MLNLDDVKIETMRGKGPGGQHKNKTSSCVRATHVPTGISVTRDGRHQRQNLQAALRELERLLGERIEQKKAEKRKQRRDIAIHDTTVIRTYNYSRGTVKDHRTGRTASIKEVMDKGRFDLVSPGR